MKEKLSPITWLLLAASLWGCSYPIINVTVKHASPGLLIVFRFLLATVTLATLCKGQFGRAMHDWRIVGLAACHTLAFYAQYLAQQHVNHPTIGAVLESSHPMFTAVLMAALLKVKLRPAQWAACFTTILGIVMVTGVAAQDARGINWQSLAPVVSALSWAVLFIYSKDAVARHGNKRFTTALFAWTTVFAIPLALGEDAKMGRQSVLPLIALALIAVLAYLAYSRGAAGVSSLTTSVAVTFEVVVSLGATRILAPSKSLGATEVAGCALIVAAIAILTTFSGGWPDVGRTATTNATPR